MTSAVGLAPPGLGLGGVGGLSLPTPPPALGSKVLSGAGRVLNGAAGVGGKVVGGVVGAVALEALYPQSTAVSGLDQIPQHLIDSGLGGEVGIAEVEQPPPFVGGQVWNAQYRIYYSYERYNPVTGDSQIINDITFKWGRIDRLELTRVGATQVRLNLYHGLRDARIITFSGLTLILQLTAFVDYRNARINALERVDGTSIADDILEGGNKSGGVVLTPIRTSGGAVNGGEDGYTPPVASGSGYQGASTPTNGVNGSPIPPVPGVSGGVLNGGGFLGDGSSVLEGGILGGGSVGGIGNGGQGTGTNTSGSTGGGIGDRGTGVTGSSAGGGNFPNGGIVGGGLVPSGGTVQTPGTVSLGGTSTGTGISEEVPLETNVSSPSNTGNNTGSVAPSIPVINGSGQVVDSVPLNPAPAPDGIPVGIPGFPPIPGEVPGEISRPDVSKKPITKTPRPAPDNEEEDESKPSPVIPVPFNLEADKCCLNNEALLKEIKKQLECVHDEICDPEPEFWDFVIVSIEEPPYTPYRFDKSTLGTGEEVFIAGYLRWVVDGNLVGEELAVRRQRQAFYKPEWAEGFSLYSVNGAILSGIELGIPKPD